MSLSSFKKVGMVKVSKMAFILKQINELDVSKMSKCPVKESFNSYCYNV